MEHAIAHFRNEFDSIDVTLTAANRETTHDAQGPWLVEMIHNDPAIAPASDNKLCVCETMESAQRRFMELVRYELAAMLGEIK